MPRDAGDHDVDAEFGMTALKAQYVRVCWVVVRLYTEEELEWPTIQGCHLCPPVGIALIVNAFDGA